MAGIAFAASALLSLFLLAAAHRLPSEVEILTPLSSDAAAIRLPFDKPSEESLPKPTVAEFLPSDEPLESPTVAEFASWDKPYKHIVAELASSDKPYKHTVAEFASWDKPSKPTVAEFASSDTSKHTVAEFASWGKPYKHTVAEFASWRKPSNRTVAEFAPWGRPSKPAVAEFASWGKPSKFISKWEEVAAENIIPAPDAATGSRTVPIEVSLIPVRSFPLAHPRVVGRPSWRRLGRHCHHMPRFLRGEVRRGDFIHYGDDMVVPAEQVRRGDFIHYGDDMVVPAEQVRRGYEGGRYFAGEARTGGFHHPTTMEEISVEDLGGKQREVGFTGVFRPYRKFGHHGHGEEKERGFVNRFLDLLNLH